ncbi:hypothetical protein NVP1029O_51 [Vibrio phage 1.029.O._10N.261.55.A7]|nr:hypothetical protein NVP1029O_51 [Vibrio phage 1.029.O._10N.261.55.A7]
MSIKIEAPIKVEIKIIVVDDDGNSGEVSCDLPAMRYPTKEKINEIIKEVSESELLEKNGLRIASKRETFDYMIREKTGSDETFAMPRTECESYWD